MNLHFLWNILSKILSALSLLSVIIFFLPGQYVFFGSVGWWALVFLLFLRPLADIFPKGNVFAGMMRMRKSLAIFSGMFILAHGVGFFLASDLPLPASFFDAKYWNMTDLFGWGMLGFVVLLPLLLTSNKWSMKILKKNWKHLQRLSYVFFLAGAIHIAFVQHSIVPFVVVFLWLFCFIAAEVKRRKKPFLSLVLSLLCLSAIAIVFPRMFSDTADHSQEDALLDDPQAQSDDVQKGGDVLEQKILVVSPKCIGCGKCIRIDPDHFSWSASDRKAVPVSQDGFDSSKLNRAISACPVDAISVI